MSARPNLLRQTTSALSTVILAIAGLSAGCLQPPDTARTIGSELPRTGDEIVICGRLFHTGTRVVLWTDPGGYDAYRVHRRFEDRDQTTAREGDSPNRYGDRKINGPDAQRDRIEDTGWSLVDAQEQIHQFVLHYDACGSSRRCFEVLHDLRGLSVHFMLDIDGTIYQTLDVKERAWHAGAANDHSVGVEIAHIGAYSPSNTTAFDKWYTKDEEGRPVLIPPEKWQPLNTRLPECPVDAVASSNQAVADPRATPTIPVLRPATPDLIHGTINGRPLVQYDYTEPQYQALIRLTATLSTVLPNITLDAPRDARGDIADSALDAESLANFHGILGHYHVTTGKIDPGPALNWSRLLTESRKLAP